MTRFLSTALGAEQPLFSQQIAELEQAAGRPSADIRLTSEIAAQVRTKIAQLGLDPADTTPEELYNALNERMRQDDARVRRALGVDEAATTNDALAAVQKFLQKEAQVSPSFALKPAAVRRLFQAKPPKATMRRLGYRSLDSMLKHESLAQLRAATLIVESPTWQRNFASQIAKLQPSDFEERKMAVFYPQSSRWQTLAEQFVQQQKTNILSFKELGSLVILPTDAQPKGMVMNVLLHSLYYLNDMRAYSSFAKLQQVKPAFGKIIQQTLARQPQTAAMLAGKVVPWKVIQRYYGSAGGDHQPEVFEPHVQAHDLQWHDAADVLAKLDPALRFWYNTEYVCLLDGEEPVSLNMLDVAMNYCNQTSFTQRAARFVHEHLWHELMSRYLHQENLEAAVHQQLSRELIAEPEEAVAE